MIRSLITSLAVFALLSLVSIESAADPSLTTAPASRDKYRAYAMIHQGDAAAGKDLFAQAQKIACSLCHTTDGAGGRAGPDLFAIGDKYGRDDLIEQILFPSATIAPGYSTTVVRLKNGDVFQGIIKESNDQAIGLMGSDGKLIRIPAADIDRQQ